MIKFSIKIDDESHSLTKENGIAINKIGELLQTLYGAIDNGTGNKLTLGQIRGNCYESLHAKAIELGFKTGDFGMARQWIYADYMIGMTGFVKSVDVILTLDKKTFYPICKDFKGTDCILAYPQLFDHTENYILNYNYSNVANFIANKPFEEKATSIPKTETKSSSQTDIFGNPI